MTKTIATLAGSLRGTPRDSLVLIQTRDGPKPIGQIVPMRVAMVDGKLVEHSSYDGYAIVLHPE
jgi:hypothetical protein